MKTLDELDAEIATLGATVNASTYRLLSSIREMDEREGWGNQGYLSCAHYLNFRIGLSLGAAREHIRVAHALKLLPLTADAMRRGALSYSKARALTRIATKDDEESLLAVADEVSAAALEKLVRGVRKADCAASAAKREDARSVTMYTDDDGMIVIQCRLLVDEGALVRKAMEAVAHRVSADALVEVASRSLAGVNATAADRQQVVLHVDAETFAGFDGRCEIDGNGVPAETALRCACDASVVTMAHDEQGDVVAVGKKTRTISTPLRRKLRERDAGTCRFPGCTHTITDGHHVEHWAHGGATTLENLVSLCRRHHRYVHELGFTLDSSGDAFIFRDPLGRELVTRPRTIAAGDPIGATDVPPMPRYARIPDYGYAVSHLLHQPRSLQAE